MHKTIILDCDNTLTPEMGMTTTPLNKQVLQNSLLEGDEIMIATGRSLSTTLPLYHNIGLSKGTIICYSGALTIEIPSHRIINYTPLNKRNMRNIIIEAYKKHIPAYL